MSAWKKNSIKSAAILSGIMSQSRNIERVLKYILNTTTSEMRPVCLTQDVKLGCRREKMRKRRIAYQSMPSMQVSAQKRLKKNSRKTELPAEYGEILITIVRS